MVQAVENWSCVAGEIVAIGAAHSDGSRTLTIQVDTVTAIQGFANLLAGRAGSTVDVAIRAGQLSEAAGRVGRRITLPVRMAGPGRFFAHPDWTGDRGASPCNVAGPAR